MNRWDELITGPRAAVMRALLCKAATVAHAENGARFDPELGDNARIYGQSTSNSTRFLAGQLIEDADLEKVLVHERGLVWWLEIEREDRAAVRVYLYKAPPGARTVHGLRLDDAEIKKELSTTNGRQLELFNRSGGMGSPQLLNIMVVHYGDPVAGLERLDVGAPYLTADGIAWDWYERFDDTATEEATPTTSPLGDDGAGYAGLSLAPDESGAAGEQESPAADAEPESATSEFEALGLRDGLDEGGTDAGTDQESS